MLRPSLNEALKGNRSSRFAGFLRLKYSGMGRHCSRCRARRRGLRWRSTGSLLSTANTFAETWFAGEALTAG